MKSTKKLLCSLFAIIAVAFMIGSAFTGIAGDINGADDQGVSDSNDTPFTVVGYKDGKESRYLYEKFSDANDQATILIKDHSDVTIYVTANSTLTENTTYKVADGVDIIVNSGVKLELTNSKISLSANSVLYVHGTVDLNGSASGLNLVEKSCISAIDGKVDVTNGWIKVSDKAWIGSPGGYAGQISGATMQLNTVGDSASGYQFGTIIKVTNDNQCTISGLEIGEYDTLLIYDLDKTVFDGEGLKVSESVTGGMSTVKVRTGGSDDEPVYTSWFGKDAIVGSATVHTSYTPAAEGTIYVDFERQMSVLKDVTVTLNTPGIVYSMDVLDVEGTLILDKTIYVQEKVDVTGMLVLEDRDFLCPWDKTESGMPVEVEVSGKGIITLGYNNKWYGNGAALDPTIVSTVKLMLFKLDEGVSYQFTISGIVNINYVDEYSYFDLRGNKDLLSIEIAGFLTVNGMVNISDMKKDNMPLPIKTEGLSRIALTAVSQVYVTIEGQTVKAVGQGGTIELAHTGLSEKELASLKEWVGNDEVFEKLSLAVSGIMVVHTNGTEESRGITANIAGKVFFDGLTVGSNDNYQIVGDLVIGNSSRTEAPTGFVNNEGTIAVIGVMYVYEKFDSAVTEDKNPKFSMVGPIHFVGENAEYIVGKEKLVGPTTDYIFSLKGDGEMTMLSTSKSRVMVITGDDIENDYATLNQKLTLDDTFLLVGFTYVTIDKDKEYLGLSEDDLAALSKVIIKDLNGKLIVQDGAVIEDQSIFNHFLILNGDAKFEYGSIYVEGEAGKDIPIVGPGGRIVLSENTSSVTIRHYRISEKLLEQLVAEDPNTPYKNGLLGKSFVLEGKVEFNSLTVAYNQNIIYDESKVQGTLRILGDAVTSDNVLLVGHIDEAVFELSGLMSNIELVYTEDGRTIMLYGLASLNVEMEFTKTNILCLMSLPAPEKTPHIFKTVLTVKIGINVESNDCVKLLKYPKIEGFVVEDPTIRFTELSYLILEGNMVVGDSNEASLKIYEDAVVTFQYKGETIKDEVDIHAYGHVIVPVNGVLSIDDNSSLTITNDIALKSFAVRGTLEMSEKATLNFALGSMYVGSTATVRVAGTTLFGNDVNEATMTIGTDAHVLLTKVNFKDDETGFILKIVGNDDDLQSMISDNATVTLNPEKQLKLGKHDVLAVINAYFIVDNKASFIAESRYNIAVVTTKLPSLLTGGASSQIIAKGAVDGDPLTSSVVYIIDHIDEEGKIVEYIDFHGGDDTGVYTSGGNLMISAKTIADVMPTQKVDENSPIDIILSLCTVKKITITGNISFKDDYTIKEGDMMSLGISDNHDVLGLFNPITVAGNLKIYAYQININAQEIGTLLRTEKAAEPTGIIEIHGVSDTNVVLAGNPVVGKDPAEIEFAGNVLIRIKSIYDDSASVVPVGAKISVLSGTVNVKETFETNPHSRVIIGTEDKLYPVELSADDTKPVLNINAKLTVTGALIAGIDGTVNIAQKGLLSTKDTGKLGISSGSSLNVDGIAIVGGTDAILTVPSTIAENGFITVTSNAKGGFNAVVDGIVYVNAGKTAYITANDTLTLADSAIVYVNGTLRADATTADFVFGQSSRITLFPTADSKYVEGDIEMIGSNGQYYKLTADGEKGTLSFNTTAIENSEKFGKNIFIEGGIIVELGSDITIKEGDSIYLGNVMVGGEGGTEQVPTFKVTDVTLTIDGGKFESWGKVIVTDKTKLVVKSEVTFKSASAELTLGTDKFIGQDGIVYLRGLTAAEMGYLTVAPNGEGGFTATLDGVATVNKDRSLYVGVKDKLNIPNQSKLYIEGTLNIAKKANLTLDGAVAFMENSEFTLEGKNFIGANGIVTVNETIGGEPNGQLLVTKIGEEGAYGLRVELLGKVSVTVNGEIELKPTDKLSVDPFAKLNVNGNGKLILNTDAKIGGEVTIEGFDNFLLKKTETFTPTMTFIYGAKFTIGQCLISSGDDASGVITMLNAVGGLTEAITVQPNGDGVNMVINVPCRFNSDREYTVRAADKVTINNDITLEGSLTVETLDSITLAKGEPENEIVVSFVAGCKLVIGEKVFVGQEEDAVLALKTDAEVQVFANNNGGFSCDFLKGEAAIMTDFVLGANDAIVISNGADLDVYGKLTVRGDMLVKGHLDVYLDDGGEVVVENAGRVQVESLAKVCTWENGAEKTIIGSDGIIQLNRIVHGSKVVVTSTAVTISGGADIGAGKTLPIYDGMKIVLDDCELRVFGTLDFAEGSQLYMDNQSVLSFYVGSKATMMNGGSKITYIGAPDDNAVIGLEGDTITGHVIFRLNNDGGWLFMTSDTGDYGFVVTINNTPLGTDPFFFEANDELIVGADTELKIAGNVLVAGHVRVAGDVRVENREYLHFTETGYANLIYGSHVFLRNTTDGEYQKLIGPASDAPALDAIIMMNSGIINVTKSVKDGINLVLMGNMTVNSGKTLEIYDEDALLVAGVLNVNGWLYAHSGTGIYVLQSDPNYPITTITVGMQGHIAAQVYGSINLEGYIYEQSALVVYGNVNLSNDLTLFGLFAVDGNFILFEHNLYGYSKTAYVRGAVTLNGLNSTQLDEFYGSIRAYEYHDGPMRYVDQQKVIVTWTLNVFTKGIVPMYYTEKNQMGGYATIMISLEKYQKATLKIVRGAGEIIQASEGVWYVASYGFDVTIEIEIEDVGPSEDYELNIHEVVNEKRQPGFTAKLVSNTEQYVNEGTLSIHYTLKHLTSEGIWVYSISGFSAGVEDWVLPITLENKVSSVTFGGVLEESKYIPAGSYLVSGYATYQTMIDGEILYWVSPTVLSVSNVPVPHIETSIDEVFIASAVLRGQAY